METKPLSRLHSIVQQDLDSKNFSVGIGPLRKTSSHRVEEQPSFIKQKNNNVSGGNLAARPASGSNGRGHNSGGAGAQSKSNSSSLPAQLPALFTRQSSFMAINQRVADHDLIEDDGASQSRRPQERNQSFFGAQANNNPFNSITNNPYLM